MDVSKLLELLQLALNGEPGAVHGLSTWLILALAGYCAKAIREMQGELAHMREQQQAHADATERMLGIQSQRLLTTEQRLETVVERVNRLEAAPGTGPVSPLANPLRNRRSHA